MSVWGKKSEVWGLNQALVSKCCGNNNKINSNIYEWGQKLQWDMIKEHITLHQCIKWICVMWNASSDKHKE